MNVKPLKDLVLIEPFEPEKVTQSGIIIPDSSQQQPNQATVVAVGPKVEEIKVGDHVFYPKSYQMNELDNEGKKQILLKEEIILAIID